MPDHPSTPEAFWTSLDTSGDCWLWTGWRDRFGYGIVIWRGRRWKAHRLAHELAHGPIPPGLWVLHRCDVPACARPDHLFLGTHRDNMADMARKGRAARGLHNGNARLSDEQVADIRARYIRGGAWGHPPGNAATLAAEHGVSRQLVWKIVTGQMKPRD